MAVIKKNEIKDIVFLFGRGYTNSRFNLEYKVIHLPFAITQLGSLPTSGIFKPFWLFKRILLLDRILNKNIKGSYCCYLPNTNNFIMQAIISKSNCKEYNIIDEGLMSYLDPKFFIKKTNPLYKNQFFFKKILKFFFHFNRSIVYKNIKAKSGFIYLFNKSDFSNTINPVIKIEYPILEIDIVPMDNEHVFVFDNSIQDNVIDEIDFYILIRKIFADIKLIKLYIKFHPAQNNIESIITHLTNLEINFEILPMDLPLELVFVKSKNMTIYGIWSSLLFYAAISKHHSISFINIASKISVKAKEWSKYNVPMVFHNIVEIK